MVASDLKSLCELSACQSTLKPDNLLTKINILYHNLFVVSRLSERHVIYMSSFSRLAARHSLDVFAHLRRFSALNANKEKHPHLRVGVFLW